MLKYGTVYVPSFLSYNYYWKLLHIYVEIFRAQEGLEIMGLGRLAYSHYTQQNSFEKWGYVTKKICLLGRFLLI